MKKAPYALFKSFLTPCQAQQYHLAGSEQYSYLFCFQRTSYQLHLHDTIQDGREYFNQIYQARHTYSKDLSSTFVLKRKSYAHF